MGELMDSLLVSYEHQSVVGKITSELPNTKHMKKNYPTVSLLTRSVEENVQILSFTNCGNTCSSETFITYHTIRHQIPEDRRLIIH
jgi:hypothetical protein